MIQYRMKWLQTLSRFKYVRTSSQLLSFLVHIGAARLARTISYYLQVRRHICSSSICLNKLFCVLLAMLGELFAGAPFVAAFVSGIIALGTFGLIMSYPPCWNKYIKINGEVIGGIYLKAGEYGESEMRSTGVFIEPWNAWSSLAYSLIGFVMAFVGIYDHLYNDLEESDTTRLVAYPLFSIFYGVSAVYLGIASFLFHASHSEIWRKVDAGMTSGVVVPLFMMGLWDRARPVGISYSVMLALTVLLQVSLTHGYLPYGSSDVLLPTFVAIAWILELHPRYGGIIDAVQYLFWGRCFYAVIGGVLLRLADIRRKNLKVFNNVLLAFFGITLFPFGYYLGYADIVILLGLAAGAVVAMYPARGHVVWHVATSFSLYIWWFSLRIRSGNPAFPYSADRSFLTIALYIAVKNACRRLFMAMPFSSDELRSRTMILIEHVGFVAWGYHVLVVDTGVEGSMLTTTSLCWSSLSIPTELFHVFYQAQVATRLEDVLYMATKMYQDLSSLEDDKAASRDLKMIIHHAVTGTLCGLSYASGYANIGALVLFLHDVSDVPLDCLRLAKQLNWTITTYVSYAATLLFWIFWRLFYFPAKVLYSVAFESKSLLYPTSCPVGACTWGESPERIPFLILLGSLFVLHIIWFAELLRKGLREFSYQGVSSVKQTDVDIPVLLSQRRTS